MNLKDNGDITLSEEDFAAFEQSLLEQSTADNQKLKELLARPTRWAEEENDED